MLHQSETAKRRKSVPASGCAGQVVKAVFSFDFASVNFTAATDVLEIGMLPSGNQLLAVEVIGEGLGAITASLGLMTGEFGDVVTPGRDAGSEIGAGLNVNNTATKVPTLSCIKLAKPTKNIGLGIKLSADVAAGANKTITVVAEYAA